MKRVLLVAVLAIACGGSSDPAACHGYCEVAVHANNYDGSTQWWREDDGTLLLACNYPASGTGPECRDAQGVAAEPTYSPNCCGNPRIVTAP